MQQHGAMVLRVVRAVLTPVDADDAWSETFLAALVAYPDLPLDVDLEAWLVTVARRKAIDVVRLAGRRAVPHSELPERGPRSSAMEPDLDLHLDLYAAVAALPPRQRRAVAYHHLAGLPYAEVADQLGGTPEAARRAAADGIAALRRTHPDLLDDGGTR